jgi:TonB family protein
MEAGMAGMGAIMLMVMDGQDMWMYMPSMKKYSKFSSGDSVLAEKILSSLTGSASVDDSKVNANAKVIRSEAIDVDGQSHDCWVTESSAADVSNAGQPGVSMHDVVYTQWFDKTQGLLLRTSMTGKVQISAAAPAAAMQMKMSSHGWKFNPALEDSLFVFTPPAGATETDELIPGMAALGKVDKSPVVTGNVATKPVSAAAGGPQAYVPNMSPLHEKEPLYPAAAKGQSGMVHVLVTIDAAGNVSATEVISGKEVFRQAALDEIQHWTYHPIIRGGNAIPAYTAAMVTFLPEKSGPRSPSDFEMDMSGEMKWAARMQELESTLPRTPAEVFADTEQQSSGATGIDRFYALAELAKTAFDAGLVDKARSYANEMLGMANQYPDDWNYGNAVYTGNMVLGLIALQSENVPKARQHLLESARTKGSPQLDSFGPDMRLARALAQKGEKDTVLQFLESCRSFWKMGDAQLTTMAAAVRNGEPF